VAKDQKPKKLRGDNPPLDFVGNQEQFEKFVGASRKSGASEDDAAFDRALKKVAQSPPPKRVEKRKHKGEQK